MCYFLAKTSGKLGSPRKTEDGISAVLLNNVLFVNFVLDSKKCRPPSKLEAKSLPLTSDSLILVCPAARLTNACSKRSCVQQTFVGDNRNILNFEDTTDIFPDEYCLQRLNVYRGQSTIRPSTTSAVTGKTCSRLLNAIDSFQW